MKDSFMDKGGNELLKKCQETLYKGFLDDATAEILLQAERRMPLYSSYKTKWYKYVGNNFVDKGGNELLKTNWL